MATNFQTLIRKNRSLIILFVLVLIPIATLSYFLLYDNYQQRLAEEKNKNQQMANVIAQNLDTFISNTKGTLKGLGSLEAIKSGQKSEIEGVFKSLQLAQKEVSLYWILDAKGEIIAKYPDIVPNKSAAGKDFFVAAMQGNDYVSDRITGEMTGVEMVLIAVPYKDNDGKVAGVIGASIPLEKLQQRLNMKVGSSGYPILVSKSGSFLAHPKLKEVRAKVKDGDPIWQALRSGQPDTIDVVAPFDGKRKFFSWDYMKEAQWVVVIIQPTEEFYSQISKVFTINGLIIFIVFLVVVISAYYLVLIRKQEEEARFQQGEKLALISELAAGMAHEIRTPLTAIKGLIQLINMREDKTAPTDYLETVIKEAERIQEIINETLLLADPGVINFQPVDIFLILKEINTIMQPEAIESDKKLNIFCPDDLPLISAEANQIKQVFINLITNAMEAVPQNGGEIVVEAHRRGKTIFITVADNGRGIPNQILNKIGTPFITTKPNGTGLGLMVTYRIVQNHGGTIKVFTWLEQGTRFEISLPIINSHLE